MKEGTSHNDKRSFVEFIIAELDKGTKHNKKSIEKIAASYGIYDKN